MDQEHSDITILGGGLAGLTLALQLRGNLPDASICVLEKRQHPVPEAAFKVGESTVEAGAHYFGQVLGLEDHIRESQLPKLGLRFFFPSGRNERIEERLELGGRRFAPCPSYQLDRGRFENFLAERCLEQGIQFVQQATIDDVDIASRGRHRVQYRLEGKPHSVESRWIVDASGRRALLKRKLGLQMPSPHVANAVWFRFKKHIKVDDWSEHPGWRAAHSGDHGRWYSTNHLMGQGYWVWLIPLASGSTSLGIVASEQHHSLSDFNSFEKAIQWLQSNEPQCAAAVENNLHELQDFGAIKHYSTECKQVFSARRWGITGEAGFFHDPFYSPGSDFIAFSNTFLVDLIQRDLGGRGIRIRARTYDRIFKRFYYGTLTAYRGQYALFGNSLVMPVKILWDYLIYWSITAFIFMQDRLCEQTVYLRNLGSLSRLGRLNQFMQRFFLDWHAATADQSVGGSINISEIPMIRRANQRLREPMDTRSFLRQFRTNTAQLEKLAREIVAQSPVAAEVPGSRRVSGDPDLLDNAFERVFAPEPLSPALGMVS